MTTTTMMMMLCIVCCVYIKCGNTHTEIHTINMHTHAMCTRMEIEKTFSTNTSTWFSHLRFSHSNLSSYLLTMLAACLPWITHIQYDVELMVNSFELVFGLTLDLCVPSVCTSVHAVHRKYYAHYCTCAYVSLYIVKFAVQRISLVEMRGKKTFRLQTCVPPRQVRSR